MSRPFRVWATGIAFVVVSVLDGGGDGAPLRADAEGPGDVRTALEDVLKTKVSRLLNEKNEIGASFKRGSYSRNFKKVDEATYQVTFHQDTASKDQLTTERYLLTLKRDASGKWAVANEELKDTYDGLYRGFVGDEEWFAFDKVSFNREGLKVTGTKGFLFKDFFHGKPSRFTLTAPDLAYEYTPPTEAQIDFIQMREIHNNVILKKHRDDFVFKPASVRIACVPPSCDDLESSIFTGLRKVGSSEADPKLQKIYQDAVTEYDKDLKDNYFFAFRRLPEPDWRTYTISVKKDAPKDYYIGLDYDNHEPWEVTFYATGHGDAVFAYYSEETRKAGIPPYELERRDDSEARDYQIDSLKGTVEIGLEDAEVVKGNLTYGMTIKRDLREMPFRISRLRRPGEDTQEVKNPKMFIDSIQEGQANELTWVRTGAFAGLVIFPDTLVKDTKVSLRLQFTNLDSIYKLNPSYSFMDRGGWLPFVRFADMIEDFDLTVKLPGKYQDLGVGKKVSDVVKDGVRTTRWVSDNPVNFPTVIFGDYIDATSEIKATRLDGTEIPVRVFVDKVSTQTLDTNVFDVGRGTESDVQGMVDALNSGARGIRGSQLPSVADQAANALNLYRAIYGQDYPYGKMDLVCDPLGSFYGQSPASIVYLGFGVFRGEGAVAGSAFFQGGADLSKFNKDVVAHEIGHQWWGSLIVNANARNYWFVESLAEYSSALFVEAVNEQKSKNGRKKYLEKVADWREFVLQTDQLTSVQNAPVLWGGEHPGRAYVAGVYNKGPYAFHILRETFGDEKFWAFLKQLAEDLKGKEIVTRDIQQVAEKSYGVSMDWFFDQWIRGVGIPQYALLYDVRKTEDGKYLVQGKIKQRVTLGLDRAEMPGVYYKGLGRLTFIFHNGKEFTYPKPIKIEGPETPFALKIPEEPAEVAFNKYGELLAHDVLVNRSW